MLGRMQDWPLLMHKVIDFAAVQFPERVVASRSVEGPMHYTNYGSIRERALKVAKRLERDGIKLSDRVATLAWNGYRHLETWYGIVRRRRESITCQSAALPRANRLDHERRERSARVRRPDLRAVDGGLVDRLPTIRRYVVLTDRAHMPATKLKKAIAYEDWIGEVDTDSPGRSSTSGPRPDFATPQAQPETRRACSIRIARTSCIR